MTGSISANGATGGLVDVDSASFPARGGGSPGGGSPGRATHGRRETLATASTEAKRAACLEEGADHAIDYRGGFLDKVKELTGGRGVDIVYDPIGDKVGEESLRALAWGGRHLILGFLGGGPTNIRSNYLLIKGIDAVGVRIGLLNEVDPALAAANMKALMELAAQGKLKPRISHRLPLEQAAEAGQAAAIVTSARARPFVRSVLERVRAQTMVLSQNEIHPHTRLKNLGQI